MDFIDEIGDLIYDSFTGDLVYDSSSSDLLYAVPEPEPIITHSEALIRDGFLIMSFDGENPITVNSNFTVTADFETSVEIRQALSPVYFSVQNYFNTVTFKYYNGNSTSSLSTLDSSSTRCSKYIDASNTKTNQLFTDYVCVSSQDIINGYIRPTHIIMDTCDVALNIIGGPPQNRGEDFVAESDKIVWAGLNLESQIKPGDIVRIIYLAQDLYGPIQIRVVIEGNYVSIFESKHNLLFKRYITNTDGQWFASFFMKN